MVREAGKSLGYTLPENMDWDIPPSTEMGDVSFRVGFQISKSVEKKPAEIASEIADAIKTRELDDLVGIRRGKSQGIPELSV